MDNHENNVIKLNNRNRRLNELDEYRKRIIAGLEDYNGDDLNMENNNVIYGDGYTVYLTEAVEHPSNMDAFSASLRQKMRFARFNEDKIIKTLVDYIATTYGQHYVDGEKQTQTIETIRSDRIPGFCIGNITKYLDRYDKKGTAKSDLLKAAHYLILLLNHENIYE